MFSEQPTAQNNPLPVIYHIRFQGHVDQDWTDWFGNVRLVQEKNGETLIICRDMDQAELYAVLKRIRDLGVPLLSVQQVSSHTDFPPKKEP